MADRDGITGTFYWTPPSDDIPPVTITISSTVTAGRTDTTPAPEAPKEAIQSAEEVPQRAPKELPRISFESPQSPISVPQTAPPEASRTLPSDTPPAASPQPESTGAVLRLTPTESPAPTSRPITTLTTLTSSAWNPPASPSSSSPVISPPRSHTTKVLTISLSLGGVILAAVFIAVILYTRHRHNKSVSHHTSIKGRISHPILPPRPPPLSMQQIFFPHDAKRYMPEEPEEPEEPLTPVAPLSFGARARTRAVSSVYGSDRALHARDTIGNFSGIPYSSSSSSGSGSGSGDIFNVRGPFDPDPDPDPDIGSPPLPRPPRNLTGNRRSSVFSNYRPRLEERESWGGLDGIGEDDEDGDVGEMWEERRRVF